jgi:hypothetical protein
MRGKFMAEMSFLMSNWCGLIKQVARTRTALEELVMHFKGMTAVHTRFLGRGRCVSGVAALASDGMVAVETTMNTVNSFDFV